MIIEDYSDGLSAKEQSVPVKFERLSTLHQLNCLINKLEELELQNLSPCKTKLEKVTDRLKNLNRYQMKSELLYKDELMQYERAIEWIKSPAEFRNRIKATIQACLKKLIGSDGKIEDLHLITKAFRGSSAYWRTALNECVAKIRSLGPPTYFISCSCNDLYWIDMRTALLIADAEQMTSGGNHPSFDTPEGIATLDRVATCEMPAQDDEIYKLVKKCQTHRHSATCQKNHITTRCRFSFPRQKCTESHIVSHSSDEFIQNGGRICLLKRRKEDQWPRAFENVERQPFGSNESTAYYVAKYISKAEPTELNVSVALAIREIRREESDISQKLFKICMRIMNERLRHLTLTGSSRQCIFLNTRKPEQGYRMLKFETDGRSTGDFFANIFQRYENRPREPADYNFPAMCLMEFTMRFQPHYRKPRGEEESEGNVDQDANDKVPFLEVVQIKAQIKYLNMQVLFIRRHIRICSRKSTFTSDMCKQLFHKKLLLITHILNHTKDKFKKYGICNKMFTRKSHLKIHMRIHTGQKPCKCKICHKSSNLKVHTRTHISEKLFKCEMCDNLFTQETSLKVHTRTHTGENPYKCDVSNKCGPPNIFPTYSPLTDSDMKQLTRLSFPPVDLTRVPVGPLRWSVASGETSLPAVEQWLENVFGLLIKTSEEILNLKDKVCSWTYTDQFAEYGGLIEFLRRAIVVSAEEDTDGKKTIFILDFMVPPSVTLDRIPEVNAIGPPIKPLRGLCCIPVKYTESDA
ncbi:hypothetical protein AGLY_017986 [Aphis glycines]|uniref:C2H2-type domain-containing protein n=1 Tax=Aphis glycines TaxID=307491 RepID=A0A6G0STY8_APHGL|nr:hypothetical protein AGLY_017986 [Aphis glycines]